MEFEEEKEQGVLNQSNYLTPDPSPAAVRVRVEMASPLHCDPRKSRK
jgi:hypothetical protein